MANPPEASNSSSGPSPAQRYRPYFPPREVAYLISQNAGKLTPARIEQLRQLACGLIDKIGGRLGFPRRTIATAQVLYHRFHLFFPLKDFAYQDVSIAALLVASKLEDTLKKLRDVQIAAYQVKAAQDGVTAIMEPDQQLLDGDRSRLIGIERLILETISFNFNLRTLPSNASAPNDESTAGPTSSYVPTFSGPSTHDVFHYIILFSRRLFTNPTTAQNGTAPAEASKQYAKRAFRLAIDAYRTTLPLSYPPHFIAAACLNLTHFLSTATTGSADDESVPQFGEGWANEIKCDIQDIEDVCHGILDLLLAASSPNSGAKSSSSSGELLISFESPSEALTASTSKVNPSALLINELTQIKIALREQAAKRDSTRQAADSVPRKRHKGESSGPAISASLGVIGSGPSPSSSRAELSSGSVKKERTLLGRDDITVRFLWDTGEDEK